VAAGAGETEVAAGAKKQRCQVNREEWAEYEENRLQEKRTKIGKKRSKLLKKAKQNAKKAERSAKKAKQSEKVGARCLKRSEPPKKRHKCGAKR